MFFDSLLVFQCVFRENDNNFFDWPSYIFFDSSLFCYLVAGSNQEGRQSEVVRQGRTTFPIFYFHFYLSILLSLTFDFYFFIFSSHGWEQSRGLSASSGEAWEDSLPLSTLLCYIGQPTPFPSLTDFSIGFLRGKNHPQHGLQDFSKNMYDRALSEGRGTISGQTGKAFGGTSWP